MKKNFITYLFLLMTIVPGLMWVIGIDFKGEKMVHPIPLFQMETGEAIKAKTTVGFLANLHVDLSNYRNTLENYYNYSNALKPVLMKPFYALKSDLFNVNPIPNKVIIGEDGWLFLGDINSNVLLESKGILTYSSNELTAVKDKLLAKSDWFKLNNIKYYMSIAPSKHSVYGEFIPIRKSKNKTKFEQLKQGFESTKFKLIDLTDFYDQHKNEKLCYKTDSHWTDLGAFLGYKKIMSEIQSDFPELKPLVLNDFKIDTVVSYHKELARMMGVSVKEENEVLILRNQTAVQVPSKKMAMNQYIFYQNRFKSSTNSYKVLVFGDSFSFGWEKFLKESFGETVFYSNLDYSEELILKEKPDLVIQEMVEREL